MARVVSWSFCVNISFLCNYFLKIENMSLVHMSLVEIAIKVRSKSCLNRVCFVFEFVFQKALKKFGTEH